MNFVLQLCILISHKRLVLFLLIAILELTETSKHNPRKKRIGIYWMCNCRLFHSYWAALDIDLITISCDNVLQLRLLL